MNNIKTLLIFLTGLITGMLIITFTDSDSTLQTPTSKNTLEQKSIITPLLTRTTRKESATISHKQKITGNTQNSEQDRSAVTEKVITFVANTNIPITDNFEELMQNTDNETEVLYQQLNTDFYNLFQFSNKKEYQRLLENGMPTPEELAYVYQADMSEIADHLNKLLSTANASNTNIIKKEKLASIALNRAIDELVVQMKNYKSDYQFGDPVKIMDAEYVTDNPADIMLAIKNINTMTAHTFGDLATSQLARVRYLELNIPQYDMNQVQYQIIAYIAKAESRLFTQNISKMYSERNNWSDEIKSIYSSIKVAL